MNNIESFKIRVSIILASLFTAVGYELKSYLSYENKYFFCIVTIASIILSFMSAETISNFLIDIRMVRRLIFRKKDIEGIWRFKAESSSNPDTDIIIDSITKISYDGDHNSFKIVGRRTDKNGREVNTNSIFSKYDAKTGEFVNVTRISGGNEGITTALGYGHFISDLSSNNINKYNGILLFEDKGGPIKIIGSAKREEEGK